MKSLKRRSRTDKVAHWVITLGGAATIFVIFALFFFIFLEVYPLLKGAEVLKEKTYPLQGKVVSMGVDEHQEVAYAVYQDGNVDFISLLEGRAFERRVIASLNNSLITQQSSAQLSPQSPFSKEGNNTANQTTPPVHPLSQGDAKPFSQETDFKSNSITSVYKDNDRLVLGTNDGRIITVSIRFSESFDAGKRTILPEFIEEGTVLADDEKKGITCIVSKGDDTSTVTAILTEDNRLVLISSETERTLFGEGEKKETKRDITELIAQGRIKAYNSVVNSKEPEGEVRLTSLALDLSLENLYAGTSPGEVIHINLQDRENPFVSETIKVSQDAVTALGFLLGDVSLVVGDERGGVNVWMPVRNEVSPSGWSHKKVHTLRSHNASVMAVAQSMRDKGFVTVATDGTIHLNHSTSERTLLTLEMKSTPSASVFSPKANGILVADSTNNLFHWYLSNPHPEINLKTLFGRVWYEGYEKPEFVWQSTGGTDDFEPKLSLVPLIFGTIKGTLYALLIAVPIGILAALYTSQFLQKTLKVIKPVIEIMAALPSVILGFLAGLWLAPLMERTFPAIVTMPFFIVLFIALALYLWKYLPARLKGKYHHGAEALFLIPFIIGAVYLSIQLNTVSESFLFSGDYKQWLLNIFGLNYDQRNALVVGFAMGFAVIPLVFTISEDAMGNVPNSLISASLALGATPWQTAVRVVLPTASPGIFSAVMIGFGRAVGETMIVLMATGNTPIMDWNLFNGFRALAANIAVEIPEAPVGGTLYRVLFLAALLLFVTTFIINTFAETVRQRMRQRYSKL